MLNFPKAHLCIILTLALYFGWLLSFPFYGPVLYASAPVLEYRGFSLPFIFTFFHTITYLLAGLLLKEIKSWKKLMFFSLIVTIGTVTSLPFMPGSVWPWFMALFGVSSSIYVIGWSYPFATFITIGSRLKIMASVIIAANIIFLAFKILTAYIPPTPLLLLSSLPPWLALLPMLSFPADCERKSPILITANIKTAFPSPLLLIFCLFIAGLYICGGFMYNIMLPFLWDKVPLLMFYRFLPYIAALIIMWRFGEWLHRYFLIFMGVSFLGLAFISLAIGNQNTIALFLTTTLIESAFALLDLFIWTTLGDLASIYGSSYKIFGFALAAKLFSILTGELIGEELVEMGKNYRLFTALLAAAAVFLTYTVIPWLNQRIQKDLYQRLGNENNNEDDIAKNSAAVKNADFEPNPLERAINLLDKNQKLTPKETEIVALLLKGMANKDIAAQLYISVNTLKTHLRNIYAKYGVTQKKELFTLLIGKDTGIPYNHN
jgi:DNA-binding CsgD family transcriptional regulator